MSRRLLARPMNLPPEPTAPRLPSRRVAAAVAVVLLGLISHGRAALAVWEQSDAAATRVLAVAYRPGRGWEAPARVLSIAAAEQALPQVALEPSGDGWAVWLQPDRGRRTVVVRRFFAEAGWQAAQEISSGDDAREVDLTVDAAGGAHAVWVTATSVRAARYVRGFGWRAPVSLSDPALGGPPSLPRVAADPDGGAMLVWAQAAAPRASSRLWARDRPPGGEWNAPVAVASLTIHPGTLDLAAGEQGEVTVVWTRRVGGSDTPAGARRFVPSLGWFEPVTLGQRADVARVCALPGAQALAAWRATEVPGGGIVLLASHFRRSDQWNPPVRLLETDRADWAFDLAAGAGGQTFALWQQWSDAGWRLWARRFDEAWGPAEGVSASQAASQCGDRRQTGAFEPRVSVDAAGNALAAWLRVGCESAALWSSRYRVR